MSAIFKANVQYACNGETITFAVDMHEDDPVTLSCIAEVNGKPVDQDSCFPRWFLQYRQHDVKPKPGA